VTETTHREVEPARASAEGETPPMIRLDRVGKVYPGTVRPAIGELSMDIPRGSVVTLVGPSGCGKTTALKLINRLIEPTSGTIEVDGRSIMDAPAYRLRLGIGYVIQQVGLFPHRTVAQNIATVPRLLEWDRARIDARVDELVALVGLDPGMRDRFPAELSGGQQQRVGVARALAADPPVLLMDEPFGAVDPIVRNRLQDELLSLQDRLHKTIVFVTHDIDEAIKLGDRMAILNVGGVLEHYGSPDEILREPANEFVEQFLGGERGLKRLALVTLGEIELTSGPIVRPDAKRAEVLEVMEKHGVDWVGVVSADGKLLGWVGASDLDARGRPKQGVRPFRVKLEPKSTLREALNEIIVSRTHVAVVCDEDDRYLGMTTIEQIRAAVAQ
jgi:osmoprotectant transport system ATP-binding protein